MASCDGSLQCLAGLDCIADSCTRICDDALGDVQCTEFGLICPESPVGGGDPTCTTPGPLGTVCSRDSQCEDPITCSAAEGLCGGMGASCSSDSECRDDIRCSIVDGTCGGEGAECLFNNDDYCHLGLICNSYHGQCRNRAGRGGSCLELADCRSGSLICQDSQCAAGDPCPAAPCAGLCNPVTGVCQDDGLGLPTLGEVCSDAFQVRVDSRQHFSATTILTMICFFISVLSLLNVDQVKNCREVCGKEY